MKKNKLIGLVAGIFTLMASVGAEATLITNGSFETPVVSGSWGLVTSGSTGWDVNPGSTVVEYQNSSLYGPARDGNQFVELDSNSGDGNPYMYQYFNTVVGLDYELLFSISPRPGIANNVIQFGIDNVSFTEVLYDAGSGVGSNSTFWTDVSYLFTANSVSTGIGFRDYGPDDSLGSLLDNVSVAAVPEPSILALVGLGLVGIGFTRRRNKV